jgi:hypothetical protein
MIVDCDRCEVRGDACQECVITVLLGATPGGIELDATDQRALDTLAEAGMVPRLQLVARYGGHAQAPTAAGADSGAHVPNGAERSPVDGERSKRHVS